MSLVNVGSSNEAVHPHAALSYLSQIGLGGFIGTQKAQKSEGASQEDEDSNARGVTLGRSSFS